MQNINRLLGEKKADLREEWPDVPEFLAFAAENGQPFKQIESFMELVIIFCKVYYFGFFAFGSFCLFAFICIRQMT